MYKIKYLSILIVFLSLAHTTAHADVPTLQNSVEKFDPGRATEELKKENEENKQLPPNIITIPSTRPPGFQGTSGTIKFKCTKITLVGNKVFNNKQLSALYKNKINTEITLSDLDAIAQQITEYYRNAGYVLSQALVPTQKISEDGVVTIQIIEGYISKVNISGTINNSVYKLLKSYGEHLTKPRPLNLKTLERYTFLANDIPGINVRAVLTRSSENTGASDLTFITDEKNISGYIAFNDYSSTVLGRQQVIANAAINNLLTANSNEITGIISRIDSRLKYISLSHSQQLNSDGLGLNLYVSEIKTNPNMESIGLENFYLPGEAFTVTADIEYAWIRSHRKNLYIGLAFKFLNSFTEFGGSPLFKDDLRSLRAHILYNFLQNSNNFNTAALNFSQGLKILDAIGSPPSRSGEQIAFSKLDLYLSNMHRFSNQKFSSTLAIKAQYAFNILPSSETFGYGGIPFGYGYDPSEFTGDHGIAARVEVQYTSYILKRLQAISEFFAFIDCGYIWDINKSVQPTSQSGASTGLGDKIKIMNHLDIDFIVAAPLRPSTITGTPNYVRFLFNFRVYA